MNTIYLSVDFDPQSAKFIIKDEKSKKKFHYSYSRIVKKRFTTQSEYSAFFQSFSIEEPKSSVLIYSQNASSTIDLLLQHSNLMHYRKK